MERENINYNFSFGGVKFNIDVSSRFSTGTVPTYNNQAPMLHFHAKHEMFFVDDEPIRIYTENSVLEYTNCIVIVPPFKIHRAAQNKNNRLLVSCEAKDSYTKNGFATFICDLFSNDDIHIFTTETNLGYLLELIGKLIKSPVDLANKAAAATIELIFYTLYLDSKELKVNDYSIKPSYLMTIEHAFNTYALTHGAEEFNLNTVAKQIHLSTKQTSRLIHKYFGKSLSELVIERRLTYAKQLLATTDLPVGEISRRCNFRSENYFYLTFKRTFGCTPAKYRKNNRDM